MAKLRVTIIDEVRNRRLKVDLPDDAAMDKLLPALAKKLGLPPAAYQLTHETTGRALGGDQTLASFGVGEGDALRLAAEKAIPLWQKVPAWGWVGIVLAVAVVAFLIGQGVKPEPTPAAVIETTTPAVAEAPTDTPVVPTLTPLPPTATPVPTSTPRPTATPVPPTDTPVPPTARPVPTSTPKATPTREEAEAEWPDWLPTREELAEMDVLTAALALNEACRKWAQKLGKDEDEVCPVFGEGGTVEPGYLTWAWWGDELPDGLIAITKEGNWGVFETTQKVTVPRGIGGQSVKLK